MEPSLLAAILEHPEDDWPRLVMADFLEEARQADRAAFIRIQIELAAFPAQYALAEGVVKVLYAGGENMASYAKGHVPKSVQRECSRFLVLRQREQELLCSAWGGPAALISTNMVFRRGFVAEVSCDTAAFLALGQALVTCQPLERVTLTDCRAVESDREPGFRSYALVGPEEHLDAIRRSFPIGWHETAEGVLDALSAAALTWARGQAACPRCEGTGWISLVDIYPRTGVDSRHCPDCAGTGRRGGRTADVSR